MLIIDVVTAGKIHVSEATKWALDSSSDVRFDVELRGQIDVKVCVHGTFVTTGQLSFHTYSFIEAVLNK